MPPPMFTHMLSLGPRFRSLLFPTLLGFLSFAGDVPVEVPANYQRFASYHLESCRDPDCAAHVCYSADVTAQAAFVLGLALCHPSRTLQTAFQFPCPYPDWIAQYDVDDRHVWIFRDEEWHELAAIPFPPPHQIFIDLVAPEAST